MSDPLFLAHLELETAHREAEALHQKYVAALERLAQVNAEVESREQQKASLERDIQSLSNAHNALSVKHLAMKKEVEVFESSPPAVKKRLDAEIVELERRKSDLERSIDELAATYSQRGAELLKQKEERRRFVMKEDIDA
jgi:chromosome segregation ATPase